MSKALVVANLAGFASFLINDMELLQTMGYQVFFAANANVLEWGDTRKKLENLGVEFIQVDFDSQNPINKNNIEAYKQIKRLLKIYKFDFVHCHTPIAGLVTRMACRRYRKRGLKVAYTTHGFAFTSNSSKKTWLVYNTLEKFASRYCDTMITINREDFNNAKKMKCQNVYYINGVGVDTQLYRNVQIDRQEYRKQLGISDDQIMILSVGELSERKNHVVIVDAIAELQDNHKYVYVICGNGINGGTGEMLRQRALDKGVQLKLLGFRFDIPEITYCSDIGAIPSKREGLGLAGVQSLAAGVPLVGTDVQGIRDYIIDGQTGYLCKATDVKGFASTIDLLAKLHGEKRKIVANQCREVAQNFDVSVSKKQMKKIYKTLLKSES